MNTQSQEGENSGQVAGRAPADGSDAAPRRRLEAVIRIGADDIHELVRAIDQISFDVDRGTVRCVSGGPSSGWFIEITEDESVTHDSYFKALNAYLKRQNDKIHP